MLIFILLSVIYKRYFVYGDIVWLLNQDTCQLRYKSWILRAPFVKHFHKVIQSGESSGFGEVDVN